MVAMVGAGCHGVQAVPGDLGRAAAPLGLGPGDRVLLAVFPARDALAVYSFAVVDQALRARMPRGRAAGRRSWPGSSPRSGLQGTRWS